MRERKGRRALPTSTRNTTESKSFRLPWVMLSAAGLLAPLTMLCDGGCVGKSVITGAALVVCLSAVFVSCVRPCPRTPRLHVLVGVVVVLLILVLVS